MWRSRDPHLELWNPLISPERLNIETSNLAHRWMAVSTKEKKSKFGQRGHVEFT